MERVIVFASNSAAGAPAVSLEKRRSDVCGQRTADSGLRRPWARRGTVHTVAVQQQQQQLRVGCTMAAQTAKDQEKRFGA
ncbi:hypothetical protein PTT_03025 [Pyrenophora teres f. teres 0-1]|uniref:Uncharacterized protein n=1 Tax=Pyrenophora teres f. teres (strain 0-1) TaxID=861557 RepID=E3RDU5_PYRTT|nr:hypothetical protein PTT_03025 [Pyrenophora teres f. teres 0-1]